MRKVIAAGLLVACILWPATPAVADDPGEDCRLYGTCTVDTTITNDEATIHATQPGDPGTGAQGSGPRAPAPPSSLDCGDPICRTPFEVTGLPTPTLDDLIGFRPTPAVDHMEPNGWFIVNLDANFYATGGSSIQTGTLIGYPAAVRFTPIRWSWTYGDGASATNSTSGTTWAAQGITEFDPTPTSHVYSAPGTYYIDLVVGYRAEYTFGSSAWGPIDGILWLPANRLVATVGGAKTVLVERDCTKAPTGPGC